MSERTLVHVARLPQMNGAQMRPEAIWLDTNAIRFVIVPVVNGDTEAAETPMDEYLAAHPDRADAVRATLSQRLQDPPPPTPGGRAKILDRKKNLNADELIARITPENVHPEIGSGPRVGKEIW